MFGVHQDNHCPFRAVLFCAVFVLSVGSVAQQQEAQDELRDKHVTSPLIQGRDFEHRGDMTIFHGQYEADEVGTRQERHVVVNPFAKWPGGIIPYEISTQFTFRQRQIILQAMQHWEDNTCIDFRPKVSSDVYSIYIMRDSGCYSFVGRLSRRYQPQGVSLGTGCVFDGVVIHELGHVIGFYHEHTRPDRDRYIDVIYGNIRRGFEDQFRKFRSGETNTLGLGYDLQSIMHYDRNTFSRDGSDTIRPKDRTVISFGNNRQLSRLDIAKANRFYNCQPPTPPPPPCGGVLNTASGSFQTPNWPETYPVNIDCQWRIRLPDASKLVELKCDHRPFGIAGNYPICDRDHLKIYDGHSTQDDSYGPYCYFTPPDVLKMSSNLAMAVFHAGPSHNPSRVGFRCTFQSVEAPTTLPPPPPPITPPTPCGGVLKTSSGLFQTPNWPGATYPVNLDCQWIIELPDRAKLVEINCDHEPFGIAGSYPDCDRDHLKFYDGHSTQDKSYGPYCHFAPPEILKMSSNLAMAVFHAGPSHNPSRVGFRCTFQSVNGPTTSPPPPTTTPSTKAPPPPTTPVPPPATTVPPPKTTHPPPAPSTTVPPISPEGCPLRTVPTNLEPGIYECDAFINPGKYIGLSGFPSLVGQSTPQDCDWTIVAPTNHNYQVRITYLDLPASSGCSSHSLTVYDGLSQFNRQLAKLCGNICEEQVIQLSGNFAFIKLHMDSKGAFRGVQAIVEEVP